MTPRASVLLSRLLPGVLLLGLSTACTHVTDPVHGGVGAAAVRTAPAGEITVAVAGDVHFAGSSATALDPGGLAAITPVLSAADVSLVNLETAVTDGGTPAAKQYTFKAPARALSVLRTAGVDVVGMANNHGLDYGTEGLDDTLAASRSSGLPVIGVGRDVEAAFAPWRTTIRGHRLVVFDATQVLDSSLADAWTAGPDHAGTASVKTRGGRDRLVAAVRSARGDADSVVVLLHWGREREQCPTDDQEGLAAALVAAGADAVVGSHAHRLLGAGFTRAGSRTGYVDYGLGNFVFYARGGAAARTGVLTLTLGAGRPPRPTWTPAEIDAGVPVPLTGSAATTATTAKDALRSCTGLRAQP
ncbi:CapA family protein [Kineococcus sp. TBRC 1896]|uniref:CapA family protein n=1 Tax=Kineococcus mangrovi TaxID=1660183 RepID=A0ABV4I1B1_9ACTN